MLGRIRALNRLQCVGETFRQALNAIALVDPQWLLTHADPEWVDRYGRRFDDNRLSTSRPECQDSAQQVGADGYALLEAISHPQTPAWLTSLPAIQTLQQVWRQQFFVEAGQVRWRTVQEGIPPSSLFISSPYDTEARYAKKRSTSWVGYKVHLTESCEESAPHLIVHVETTPSPVADGALTPAIHQTLQDKDLLPEKHLGDTGYLDAHLLVQSQQKYDVDLVGPTRADYRWQARADEGFAASEFPIDWEARQATCPAGHTSISWTPAVDRGHQTVIKIKFSSRDCRVCPSHHQCTKAKRRTITIRSREEYEALNAARLREETEEFRREYDRRAGIEGTVSQGVRVCGLRRSRYGGKRKHTCSTSRRRRP